MQAPLLAAAVAAACLLSACGFVPPAPPMPPDTKRVAINHGDPRKSAAMQQTSTSRPESISIPLAPPSPASGPTPTPRESGASATNATDTTNRAQPLPIPVPAAPSATVAPHPTPAQPAPTESATGYTPGQTITPPAESRIIATNTVPMPPALTDLPATAPAPAPAPDSPASGPRPTDAPPSVPEPIPDPIPVVVKEIWRINPDDGTVRQALARWAAKANWTFGPDQWELNFDLPIQAPAEFEAESFQEATQALSQAIAMTESPVRPCFYANRVLRMVPFTRSCNRSPATQS